MSTYELRQRMIGIARMDVGKVEESKNRAPWIAKYWSATNYPNGYDNREPYCAAAMCYVLMRWLSSEDVLFALGMTAREAEQWRCKSASVFRSDGSWLSWAETAKEVTILPPHVILHAADLVIYDYSHIELVTNDDNTEDGPFVAIGMNTNKQGSRDGDGCYEKPRSRSRVQCFIRLLE
jgi:hypothetical protein